MRTHEITIKISQAFTTHCHEYASVCVHKRINLPIFNLSIHNDQQIQFLPNEQ